MYNSQIITEFLQKTDQYPDTAVLNNNGLQIELREGYLSLSGSPCELIDLADLLVSLALSGENVGQHWHVDTMTLISDKSLIPELVLSRTE